MRQQRKAGPVVTGVAEGVSSTTAYINAGFLLLLKISLYGRRSFSGLRQAG